jgi:GST-like protein
MPQTDRAKYEVLQWLMFQMGTVGPMLGQVHHFRLYAPEKVDYAINRYSNEARRIYAVTDQRLSQNQYIGGSEYSIADIATFPWLRSWERQGIVLGEYPYLQDWFNKMAERPAVQRGVKVMAELRRPITGEKEREILFGKTQYERH